MEEKKIIESKLYSCKKLFIIFLILGLILALILVLRPFVSRLNYHMYEYKSYQSECQYDYQKFYYEDYDTWEDLWAEDFYYRYNVENKEFERVDYWWNSLNDYGSAYDFAISSIFYNDDGFFMRVILIIVGYGSCLLFCLLYKKTKIILTDKRIEGRTFFGRRLDLPFDSISAVGSTWLKGIIVSTSSGKISFIFIKNAREIHAEISRLLIERQEKQKKDKIENATHPKSGAEEIKKYKELFDNGIISQEEFESKKRQLLGL